MSQDVISPGPEMDGFSGRSELPVLLVKVMFSGEYETIGTWSITVMLR